MSLSLTLLVEIVELCCDWSRHLNLETLAFQLTSNFEDFISVLPGKKKIIILRYEIIVRLYKEFIHSLIHTELLSIFLIKTNKVMIF